MKNKPGLSQDTPQEAVPSPEADRQLSRPSCSWPELGPSPLSKCGKAEMRDSQQARHRAPSMVSTWLSGTSLHTGDGCRSQQESDKARMRRVAALLPQVWRLGQDSGPQGSCAHASRKSLGGPWRKEVS